MNRRLRIVQAIHTFPPVSQAGSEIYTFNLAKELARQHHVTVFYRIADQNREEYELQRGVHDGVDVCTVNNTFRNFRTFEDTYRNEAIAKRFGELLDEIKPDIVHFQHLTCLSTTCVQQAKQRNIPVVYTLHDYWLICPRGQFVRRDLSLSEKPENVRCVQCMAYQLDIEGGAAKVAEYSGKLSPNLSASQSLSEMVRRKLSQSSAHTFFAGQTKAIGQIQERTRHIKEMCSLVDLFIAPSRFLMEKYKDFGIPEEKAIYSDYGFDDSLFANFTNTPSEKIRFGYIGTLIPTKGVHTLIEAFNQIDDPRAELVIWGKDVGYEGVPDYGTYLEGLVRNPKIRFGGEYDNKKIAEVLAGIDVLVVPSLWYENSPLTIHEAFMAKIPLIVSGIGGMAELVQDGVDGLHFQMGNVKDLAAKMNSILEHPSRIAELSSRAPKVKTIQEDAGDILTIYDALLID